MDKVCNKAECGLYDETDRVNCKVYNHIGNCEAKLNDGLYAAEFRKEFGKVTLRTSEGWLLWSADRIENATLGEIIEKAIKHLNVTKK